MLVMMLLVVSLVVRFREIYRETYGSVMSAVGREMLRLTKNKLKMYGKDTPLDLDSDLKSDILWLVLRKMQLLENSFQS